jgi:hypothetical protein
MEAAESRANRNATCAQCGVAFGCGLSGDCWCADESFRLPLPTDASDCLCPDCLRALAQQQSARPA